MVEPFEVDSNLLAVGDGEVATTRVLKVEDTGGAAIEPQNGEFAEQSEMCPFIEGNQFDRHIRHAGDLQDTGELARHDPTITLPADPSSDHRLVQNVVLMGPVLTVE